MKEGKTKSIRDRFLSMNLISVFLCTLLIGGFGLWSTMEMQMKSYQDILRITAQSEGQRLNDSIDSIKASVDLFSEMTDSALPSLESLQSQEFLDHFYTETQTNMQQICDITYGLCAYYFRIAPELTPQQEGFFYGKRPGSERIMKEPITDLSLYEPSDIEHVGWYYQPLDAGHASWLEPYYNQNLDIYMLSYVVPLYRDGVFWGVAGMDIDFGVVIEQVQAIHPFETGYAFLANENGKIFYHPGAQIGDSVFSLNEEVSQLLEQMAASPSNPCSCCFRYRFHGEGKTLSCFRLNNGMILMLTVSDKEINRPVNTLLHTIVIISFLLFAVVASMNIYYSNRLIQPLAQLTEAARQISLGNLNVALPRPDDSEVGILTKSFEITIQALKKYIAQINNIALTDALTHVKNKAAYDNVLQSLQDEIDQGKTGFGMVMCDLNDLKLINDLYGHEKGDEYLVNSCNLICSVFQHSPVYRIGGDEFLVLLKNQDLLHADSLMQRMQDLINDSFAEQDPWKRLKIAKGISLYSSHDTTPADVFQRADKAMYADKKKMKESSL